MKKHRLTQEEADWLRPPERADTRNPWRQVALGRQEDPELPVVTFYHACGHVSIVDYAKVRPECKRMNPAMVRRQLRGGSWWWVGQGVNAPCLVCNHGGGFQSRQTMGKRRAGYQRAGEWSMEEVPGRTIGWGPGFVTEEQKLLENHLAVVMVLGGSTDPETKLFVELRKDLPEEDLVALRRVVYLVRQEARRRLGKGVRS